MLIITNYSCITYSIRRLGYDYSVTYIGELEAGKKDPTIVIIEKIANALEVEISELFKEEII